MDLEDETRATQRRSPSFALLALIAGAAFVITLAGMKASADIIGPVFLALVLTVTVHPVRVWLERTRLPTWLVSIVMLVLAYLLIVVLVIALTVSVAQFASMVPQYSSNLADLVNDVGTTLTSLGVDQKQIDAMAKAIDPGQLVGVAASLLGSSLGVLTDLFFLFTVLLFMVFDTNNTRRALAVVGGRFPHPVAALAHFARGTRGYMGVSAGFGLIVAVIDGVALYLMDIPGALAWAVLAFVTNFIPNIGFVIGLVPPALIALLDSGLGLMIAVIVVYSVINFTIQSIIQPRVVGDAVGLSPTLTFLSLVFWTWVIGPLGAILAVPLSLFARAVLAESDPSTRWALPLISGKIDDDAEGAPAPPPPG